MSPSLATIRPRAVWQRLAEQGRRVGLRVVQMEEDLVAEALGLRLESPDDIGVEDIERRGHGGAGHGKS